MIAGIDVSTKQIAVVLLDDDSDEAYASRFDLPSTGAQDAVEAVRAGGAWELGAWLIGIEDPHGRFIRAIKSLGMVCGAVAAIQRPASVPILWLPPTEWKRETCGVPMAKKDEVAAWVGRTWPNIPALVDQDTIDAYAIAYAARKVNARAVEAAG